MVDVDPITLEVVQAALISVVREMRATVIRTSYSSVLYEGHDFSCALLDSKAELVAQSEDHPAHIFPICWAARSVQEKFGDEISPGDVFLMNDPYVLGTHMNDVAMIYPYFAEGKLDLFIVVRAHWQDVGGSTPGSISGRSTVIFQEGVRIPPIKVLDRGDLNHAVLDLMFANMRLPDERENDFMALHGACKTAERRLLEIYDRYGADTLEQCINALLDRAERRMRQAVSQLPPGEYYYEHYLDSDGVSTAPVPLRCRLVVDGDSLVVDFTGSAPQGNGPMNCGLAGSPTAAFIVLKSFLDPQAPLTGGAFRALRVITQEGTLLRAGYPAACGGGGEVRFRTEAAVVGALSQLMPREIAGDFGGANHTYLGGWDESRGASFLVYEYPTGGAGAVLEHDGNNATCPYDVGDLTRCSPVESSESIYPILIERCELREDSGGEGYRRGGLGLHKEIRVLSDSALLSVMTDHSVIPPFGVVGAYSGAPNSHTVIREGARIKPSETPGKVTGFPLKRDDVVVVQTFGGGGYGDPLEREPELVEGDVAEGYVSEERARERHGVVMAGGRLDRAATEDLRRRLRSEQHPALIVASETDCYDGGRRLCLMGPELAGELGVADGDLVEYVGEGGAPLRGWVRVDSSLPGRGVPMGPLGRQMLKVDEGESLGIRRP